MKPYHPLTGTILTTRHPASTRRRATSARHALASVIGSAADT